MDFSNLKVLVIGDICLDITEEGTSTRLSPEAPVPIILNPSKTYSLGMAGNVALNLKTLGANVLWSGIYVKDESGDILEELLDIHELSRPVRHKATKSNVKTITKKRILANGKQIARIDDELPYNELETAKLMISNLERFLNEGIKFDFIIISDYNKYTITEHVWECIEPLLKLLSDKFFVDTKKKNVLSFYEGMYIFPNRKEMEEIMEYNNCKTRNELRRELDLDFLVETASENGAYLYKNDGKMYHCPPFESNVVDVTGCGDTFMAAFALYYTKYNDKKAALGFANYCCSKVIQRKGTTPIFISEVLDFDNQSI